MRKNVNIVLCSEGKCYQEEFPTSVVSGVNWAGILCPERFQRCAPGLRESFSRTLLLALPRKCIYQQFSSRSALCKVLTSSIYWMPFVIRIQLRIGIFWNRKKNRGSLKKNHRNLDEFLFITERYLFQNSLFFYFFLFISFFLLFSKAHINSLTNKNLLYMKLRKIPNNFS